MDGRQLQRLRPDPFKDPLPHPRAADRRDDAFSNLTNNLLYLDSFRFCIAHRRQSQRFIKQDTAVIDALVNVIVVQFIG